ncbi:LuxR C-terminal-related transcriptional regulator [Pseudonocardia sp. CA-142604]|uniref:LuxR C-terminal-related transcriptional regulator n=1 Tax=Pseudonocardia sp. CA-142604 TaxID=3240024 RepID=UPI003D8D50D6
MVHVPRCKTTPPVPPPEFVARPALSDILQRGLERPLTLVCAPPGYGKTLVLADWVRNSEVPSAWLALDEKDDDPRRLWGGVLAALRCCPAVPPSSRLCLLAPSRTTVGLDFLDDLLDGLDTLPVPVQLVLDGTHHLRAPEARHGLQALARATRSGLRLVLAGRVDPALPVARLRLEERLCELRAEQLRFSPDEAAALLARCGLRLTPAQAELLHARTGGWATGLQLAALALRGHPDPDAFLAEFSGDAQPVAEYLVGEVLSQIPEDERELLRRTSICDVLPAELAIELSGRDDAPAVLDRLERDTGLVVRTGGQGADRNGGYRTQELLRSYLLADLERCTPGARVRLHGRAAEWSADHGRPSVALRHAVDAGDAGRIARLLQHSAAELAARGEHTVLRHALDAAGTPAEGSGADPRAALVGALLHLGHGNRVAARAALRRSRKPPDDGDQVAADLTVIHRAAERLAGIGSVPSPEEPTPGDPVLAAWTLAGRAVAYLATGAVLAGQAELEASLQLARDQRLHLLEVHCLTLIGVSAWVLGDLPAAEAAATEAVDSEAAAGHGDCSAWATAAQAVRAHAAVLRARPTVALQATADGLRAAPDDIDPVVRFAMRTARGAALADTGDRTAGLMELQHARTELGEDPVPPPLAAAAAVLEHRAALLLGHATAALTTAGWLAAHSPACGELAVMRAWSEAASGTGAAAPDVLRSAVEPVLDGRIPSLLPYTIVEAWLVVARAAIATDERPAARHAVQTALELAEPQDALRPFALVGPELRAVLVDQLGGTEDRDAFAVRALAAGRDTAPHPAAELSAREREVLARLPSLHNLDEIADDLDVSLNTIKSHVRAIYGKLGVSSRRTAVLTAHEQGLLT